MNLSFVLFSIYQPKKEFECISRVESKAESKTFLFNLSPLFPSCFKYETLTTDIYISGIHFWQNMLRVYPSPRVWIDVKFSIHFQLIARRIRFHWHLLNQYAEIKTTKAPTIQRNREILWLQKNKQLLNVAFVIQRMNGNVNGFLLKL